MAKKTFKESINLAMQFIGTPIKEPSSPQSPPTPAKEQLSLQSPPATAAANFAKIPEGHKLSPLYVEIKSKRLQLLLQPSVYEKLKEKALADGKSVNDTVNTILREALNDR